MEAKAVVGWIDLAAALAAGWCVYRRMKQVDEQLGRIERKVDRALAAKGAEARRHAREAGRLAHGKARAITAERPRAKSVEDSFDENYVEFLAMFSRMGEGGGGHRREDEDHS